MCKQDAAHGIFGCKWPALDLIVEENRVMFHCVLALLLRPLIQWDGCILGLNPRGTENKQDSKEQENI